MANDKYFKNIKINLPKERGPHLTREQAEKIHSIVGTALVIIGAAGAITIAAMAPNLIWALGKIAKDIKSVKFNQKEKTKKVAQTLYYLKRHNLIKFKPEKGDFWISLTDFGKKRLAKTGFYALSVPKQKKWDGKWWQVAADIPTLTHRAGADLLRQKLKNMGFYSLQRTLWFYPFDPRKELEFICQHYGVGQFVTVMEVSRMDMDDEKKLKDYFLANKVL